MNDLEYAVKLLKDTDDPRILNLLKQLRNAIVEIGQYKSEVEHLKATIADLKTKVRQERYEKEKVLRKRKQKMHLLATRLGECRKRLSQYEILEDDTIH